MTASVNIPIAAFREVYDVSVVDRALNDLSPGASEGLKSHYRGLDTFRRIVAMEERQAGKSFRHPASRQLRQPRYRC